MINKRRRAAASPNGSISKSRSGFTLIEIAVCLVVFAFVIIIFASVVVMAKASSNMNGQYAQAISLCQHKIDQLRAVGHGRLTYVELNDAGIVDDSPTSRPYNFLISDSVADYLPNPTAKLALTDINGSTTLATVTITWKSSPHRTEPSSMRLDAYIVNVE